MTVGEVCACARLVCVAVAGCPQRLQSGSHPRKSAVLTHISFGEVGGGGGMGGNTCTSSCLLMLYGVVCSLPSERDLRAMVGYWIMESVD